MVLVTQQIGLRGDVAAVAQPSSWQNVCFEACRCPIQMTHRGKQWSHTNLLSVRSTSLPLDGGWKKSVDRPTLKPPHGCRTQSSKACPQRLIFIRRCCGFTIRTHDAFRSAADIAESQLCDSCTWRKDVFLPWCVISCAKLVFVSFRLIYVKLATLCEIENIIFIYAFFGITLKCIYWCWKGCLVWYALREFDKNKKDELSLCEYFFSPV